jgi:hypothetical protein
MMPAIMHPDTGSLDAAGARRNLRAGAEALDASVTPKTPHPSNFRHTCHNA